MGTDAFAYKLFLLLHLLCVIVGFGSTFVWSALMPQVERMEPSAGLDVSQRVYTLSKRLTSPFIWAAGLFGIILVVLSDKAWKFDQAWVSIAFVLFIIGVVLATFVLLPTNRKVIALQEQLVNASPAPGEGAPAGVAELKAANARVGMIGGILHLIFLLLMIDMIWKPFL
jgi:hypothetical protein